MLPIQINYLAVLVVAIINMAVGALWYSKLLFGNIWMKSAKISEKQIEESKKEMPKMYLTMFVGAFIMAFVLAHFIAQIAAVTVVDGIQAGFWAWLGFIATTSLSSVIFEGKSPNLYLLNNGYNLVSLIIMGAILAAWA